MSETTTERTPWQERFRSPWHPGAWVGPAYALFAATTVALYVLTDYTWVSLVNRATMRWIAPAVMPLFGFSLEEIRAVPAMRRQWWDVAVEVVAILVVLAIFPPRRRANKR